MLTSRLKEPQIGGLLVQCQALDNLSPRATPSSTDGHAAGTAFPRNRVLVSPPNLITHVQRLHGQRNQLVMRRRAIHRGLLIIAPLVHTIVLVFPGRLATRMFSRGEEGLETSPHPSPLQRLPTTEPGQGQEQKVVARLALPTILRQFTSLVKKVAMKSNASKPQNPKGLLRKPREKTALDCSQLAPALELP